MADALDLGSSSSGNGGSSPPPRTKGASLDYEISEDSATVKEFELRVPRAELDTLIDKEADRLRKELVIDGFRKGRVPKTLVKMRYFDDLKARALDKLLSNTYIEFLKERKWRPATQAELKNIEVGEEIKFQIRVEVIPDFELADYIGIEVMKEEPLPDDFLLKQGIKELQERNGYTRETAEPAVVDNIVTADIIVEEDGKVKNQEKKVKLKIGDRGLPDELNRILVGVKKGVTREAKIDKLLYRIIVHKVEEKVVPEVDDAFARKYGYENLEDMNRQLLKKLKQQEESRIEDELKESIARILLERHQFPVPETLIQNEYEKLLKEFELPDSDANKERFWPRAEMRVRLNLIIDKIAQQEKIQVTESEVKEEVEQLGLKVNKEMVEYIGLLMTREKTFDFLLKNAKITERSRIISPKEVMDDTGSIRH